MSPDPGLSRSGTWKEGLRGHPRSLPPGVDSNVSAWSRPSVQVVAVHWHTAVSPGFCTPTRSPAAPDPQTHRCTVAPSTPLPGRMCHLRLRTAPCSVLRPCLPPLRSKTPQIRSFLCNLRIRYVPPRCVMRRRGTSALPSALLRSQSLALWMRTL